MIDPLLKSHLEPLVRRRWHLRFWPCLAICWITIGLAGLLLLALRTYLKLVLPVPVTLLLALGAGSACWLLLRRRHAEPDWRWAARQIELKQPELEGLLLTAAQQEPKGGADFNYLQRELLKQAISHSAKHDWTAAVPMYRLGAAQAVHLLALVFCLAVLWQLRPAAPETQGNAQSPGVPGITVTPGDITLERGSSLVVMARFMGPVPASVDLILGPSAGSSNRISLVRSLADPMFGGSVPEVDADLSYRLEYAGQRTRDFDVKVFEHPKLERANASLTFPTYTGQAPKRLEDTRRLSAVEGTHLDLALQFNKPVVSARLIPKGEETNAISLVTDTNRPIASLSQFALAASKTYHLQLVDADGRTNKAPAQFVFDVLKNRRPELKLASPRGDIRPSSLEEVLFEGSAWDDFGVERYGIAYTVAGQETKVIEVGQGVPAKQKRGFQHLLPLENLAVKPDYLISWFIWADDIGPDGQTRRTSGDLFFAEVRPFEEIFREGESPSAQQQQQQQQSGEQQESPSAKLAELQKQIIGATWKLWREHGDSASPLTDANRKGEEDTSPRASPSGKKGNSKVNTASPLINWAKLRSTLGHLQPLMVMAEGAPSESPAGDSKPANKVNGPQATGTNASPSQFQSDAEVVRDSQEQALEQTETVKQRVQDPRLMALWEAAAREMEDALQKLKAAQKSPEKLKEALAAEQAAYQALLKLQEREFSVRRSRGGGQGNRQNQRQQQLEQLDLRPQDDRYESERQAQAPQAAERREQLQLLNRLQELARRQQDLNERLKELQTALQEARTETEREEVRRRLKRLQEEEQKMLADADELQQRMSRPENQSRFTEQGQQLEQARQEMQRAADAAQQGSASQALAAGTRAQRQLQQMRDEMRRQNASEFAEDMREMRAAARELARQQEEIRKQVEALQEPGRRNLSDADQRKAIVEQLTRQKERLTNLVDRATQVSQQTEDAEPLASRELYDTLRKFSQDEASSVKQLQEDLVNTGRFNQRLLDQLKQTGERDNAKALEATSEMMREGMLPQASQAEERARGSINNLRRGVERAAERVVGDDAETLRLAQRQLDQLTEQLQREMAQAQAQKSGNTNDQQQAGGSREGQDPREQQNQSGQQAQGNQRQGQIGQQPGQGGQQSDQNRQQQSQSGQQQGQSNLQQGQNGQQQGQSGQQQGQGAQQQGQTGQQQGQNNNPQQGPAQGGQQGRAALSSRSPQRNASRLSNQRGGSTGPEGPLEGLTEGWDSLFQENPSGRTGPITGNDFAPWSDRLREVEEMVELPSLRNDLATARERARQMRQEFKRERKKPDWAVVRLQVMKPLVEVRNEIADELARREPKDKLVPIDRDPVPSKYSDLVRRYYEELGKDK